MSKFDSNKTYSDVMDHLESLKPCTLITTGRTGTDFFQSLLDSHPEVLTFNGHIFFHDFWNNAKCTKKKIFALNKSPRVLTKNRYISI